MTINEDLVNERHWFFLYQHLGGHGLQAKDPQFKPCLCRVVTLLECMINVLMIFCKHMLKHVDMLNNIKI